MINQEWAFVALENGAIQAGRISEECLLGKKVLKLELPRLDSHSSFVYYDYSDVKGIRVCSEHEIDAVYSEVLSEDIKLKVKDEKYPALV